MTADVNSGPMQPSLDRIVPRSNLRNQVEESLAAAIITGEMEPGRLFSAPNLAATLGVSVTPVREAMLNLEKRGFVTTVRNKGFRVTEVSEAELQHIVQVRQLLEPPAMRMLAKRFPAVESARFHQLADTIVNCARSGDLATYIRSDLAFHIGLLELLGNDRLTAIVADLRSQTRLSGIAGLAATKELEASSEEHRQLVDHLEAGEAEAAEKLMIRHIGHVTGEWSGNPEND
ncbi:GntR family transcriptional regulator [Saccharomonospora sp. NPDC046836]|uniref:GntR family transcriptional regulator n=1 Tax=Saccharomonospora sp. NPDC046836 TaxID=3156921 RepID=UPI0033EB8B0E